MTRTSATGTSSLTDGDAEATTTVQESAEDSETTTNEIHGPRLSAAWEVLGIFRNKVGTNNDKVMSRIV